MREIDIQLVMKQLGISAADLHKWLHEQEQSSPLGFIQESPAEVFTVKQETVSEVETTL